MRRYLSMDVADNQYEASQILGSDVAAAIEPLNHGSLSVETVDT